MKVIRSFNNNAVLVKDVDLTEWIVIGNGIGFNKKVNDAIDKSKIERHFVAESRSALMDEGVISLLKMDSKIVETASEITREVEHSLNIKFENYNYLILADHISFVIERATKGIEMTNSTIRWEVKKIFPKEYEAAKVAIKILMTNFAIDLPRGEDVFLTYHFVNAQSSEGKLEETMKMSKLIHNILEIIQMKYQIILNEESFHYDRFISHLRYFVLRHLDNESVLIEPLDSGLLEMMRIKYAEAYKTVGKIAVYLEKTEGWQLTQDEKLYLCLHIWRVTNKQEL
ncbi:PRD domain-containing protein [Brochothrix thermosphacta]|uniref:PRD domain-containing protein n=1 Tax=Brochothrix thermosphacta TaxID=2756 RepID=UPI0027122851|nr:PRD domain-containing protein [Brochothrix thermosphacta]MDO7863939.1 PRD domain-containing protein [Brochothrix thermosphacta]